MPSPIAASARPEKSLAPTAVLMNEHRNIERAIAALERMADAFAGDGRIDPEPAGQVVEFLRSYADRLHHGKEESNLFPAMEARGLPAEVGPTAVMRQEHTMGRAFIQDMADAVAEENVGAFVSGARGYVVLLREHIMKEDQVLFPMADSLLPTEDQDGLRSAFERVEAIDVGRDRVAALLASVDALCIRFGVTEIPRAAGSPCGHCCGH